MQAPSKPPVPNSVLRSIPRGVWVLGLVSLFMDMSSEIYHSLLPVFLVGVLGASTVTLGLIEGVAEATAAIVKLFSGALSDAMVRRKPLLLAGYGLAALTKPVFPLATSAWHVFAGRLIDRIGKGIRGAPRDAMVADLAPPELSGASYGLRQSLDTVGAFIGPLAAIALMIASGGDVRLVFWIAVIPAIVALGILALGIREPVAGERPTRRRALIEIAGLRRLGFSYWAVIAVAAVLTMARFSEAFLILRAEDAGLAIGLVPLVMVAMSASYALSAYPAGVLADRLDRGGLLAIGIGVLIVADVLLAAANDVTAVLVGVAFWGLHMGLTQGLLAASVADATPSDLRGTGFGVFNFVTGVVLFLASTIAGVAWAEGGAPAPFALGAVFSVMALAGTWIWRRVARSRAG